MTNDVKDKKLLYERKRQSEKMYLNYYVSLGN
jgi:hypothetical protein